MTITRETYSTTVVEFGVGCDDGNGPIFYAVPVDTNVQAALHDMVQSTWTAMQKDESGPAQYQPSEKHSGTEYLFVYPGDELDTGVRDLHEADNLPVDTNALDEPTNIFCYFVRLRDGTQRHVTAIRRAIQFKGVLKKKLVRIISDSLEIVTDNIFKLDSDFDIIIDSERTHIWRPSAFEFLCDLKKAILDAVPINVTSIQSKLVFMDLTSIEKYASTRPRAARYLASIIGQDLSGVDCRALTELCQSTGVELEEDDGKISVAGPHVMGFLEVLDRRRYQIELVPDTPECFRAGSRRKIGA